MKALNGAITPGIYASSSIEKREAGYVRSNGGYLQPNCSVGPICGKVSRASASSTRLTGPAIG